MRFWGAVARSLCSEMYFIYFWMDAKRETPGLRTDARGRLLLLYLFSILQTFCGAAWSRWFGARAPEKNHVFFQGVTHSFTEESSRPEVRPLGPPGPVARRAWSLCAAGERQRGHSGCGRGCGSGQALTTVSAKITIALLLLALAPAVLGLGEPTITPLPTQLSGCAFPGNRTLSAVVAHNGYESWLSMTYEADVLQVPGTCWTGLPAFEQASRFFFRRLEDTPGEHTWFLIFRHPPTLQALVCLTAHEPAHCCTRRGAFQAICASRYTLIRDDGLSPSSTSVTLGTSVNCHFELSLRVGSSFPRHLTCLHRLLVNASPSPERLSSSICFCFFDWSTGLHERGSVVANGPLLVTCCLCSQLCASTSACCGFANGDWDVVLSSVEGARSSPVSLVSLLFICSVRCGGALGDGGFGIPPFSSRLRVALVRPLCVGPAASQRRAEPVRILFCTSQQWLVCCANCWMGQRIPPVDDSESACVTPLNDSSGFVPLALDSLAPHLSVPMRCCTALQTRGYR